MKRELIYRTDAMAAVGNLKGLSDTEKSKAMKAMLGVPPAQPEIIHCEECMYRNNTGTSVHWLPCMEVATCDYWFCGSGKRAERREE